MIDATREQIAELDCVVVKLADRQPRGLVVFCHGYGAPGDDLVPIVEEFYQGASERYPNMAMVFPAAPLELEEGFGGRAWWPIDMFQLQALAESGDAERMAETVPSRLAECRQSIEGILDELSKRWLLRRSHCMVGGFSQGAMLATDVALHSSEPIGGLVAWSGALINRAEWQALATGRSRLRVVQSHGFWDPILPFAAGTALRDLLIAAGHEVNFLSFQGYHSIPKSGLQACLRLMQDVLSDHQP